MVNHPDPSLPLPLPLLESVSKVSIDPTDPESEPKLSDSPSLLESVPVRRSGFMTLSTDAFVARQSLRGSVYK
jgi:hypothetical protein